MLRKLVNVKYYQILLDFSFFYQLKRQKIKHFCKLSEVILDRFIRIKLMFNQNQIFLIIMVYNRAKHKLFHANIILFSNKHKKSNTLFYKILATYFVKSNAIENHENDLNFFQQGSPTQTFQKLSCHSDST